ncbi:hypothetical protein [Streptomyces sp. NPDC053560]|uniref:hypothetical protein n=1 Tax=Streptomyces sp. NPDC053560 TaxID=3365711 RepID=UPI0037D6BC32
MSWCAARSAYDPHTAGAAHRGRPPLAVVLDRGADVRFTRTAPAAHDPAADRIVVHPTVVPRRRLLRHDILAALGATVPRPSVTCAAGEGAERAVHTALQAAPAWRMTICAPTESVPPSGRT